MAYSNLAAIRAARNYTGRRKVIVLLNSEASPLRGSLATDPEVEFVRSGSRDRFCRAIAESDDRIAAVVAEPLSGVDLVHRRFLRRAKDIASAEGAVFIWDETLSLGSAISDGKILSEYGVRPELVCLNTESGTAIQGSPEILQGVEV